MSVYVSVRSAEYKTNGSISTKFTTNISAEPKKGTIKKWESILSILKINPLFGKRNKKSVFIFLNTVLTVLIRFGLEIALRRTTYNMIQTASHSKQQFKLYYYCTSMCVNMIKILFYFLTQAILQQTNYSDRKKTLILSFQQKYFSWGFLELEKVFCHMYA